MIAALVFIVCWVTLALLVGVVLGMTIREADRRELGEPEPTRWDVAA
jgi:uncharacterized protein YneF (UPF0154 family)